jgi:6-phosphogluconolactonase
MATFSVILKAAMLLATASLAQEYLFVGTWTNTSSIITLRFDAHTPSLQILERTSLVEQAEKLLVVDNGVPYPLNGRPHAVLIATQNSCGSIGADPDSFGFNKTDCTVSSLGIRLEQPGKPPSLRKISETGSGGIGPTQLALSPSRNMIAVANYQSGTAAMIPFNADGKLARVSDLTQQLNTPSSLAHSVAFDSRCGANAALLLVDAGAHKMATFNTSDGKASSISSTPLRARGVVIHESQNLVYALYETDGSIGIWPWQARSSQDGLCGELGSAEISRVPAAWPDQLCANASSLPEWQPTCLNSAGVNITRPFPTEVVLSHNGRFLYVSNAGVGTVAVFAVAGKHLELLQVYATPTGARSLALSGDGGFLFAAAPGLGVLSANRLDHITGKILGEEVMVDTLINVASIAVWAPTRFATLSHVLI